MIFFRKSIQKIVLLSFFFTFSISCEAIFEEDISEEEIILLAPSNNSTVANGSIRFDWEILADSLEYRIQIATPNFENASQIILDSITTETSVLKDLIVGEYQWRVNASNTNYTTPYSTNSFTIN